MRRSIAFVSTVSVVTLGILLFSLPSAQGLLSRPPKFRAIRAAWVVQENLKTGTTDWRIPPDAPVDIHGYADHVSAPQGTEVTLYVSTHATSFRVEAYRLGYYGGVGGRMVWESSSVPGVVQPPPIVQAVTNMVEARWHPSLSFTVTPDWAPGDYLLKLIGSSGEMSYVPFCVRDDDSHAALVIQNSVTTWQAYNALGGYSLYHGPDGSFDSRSRVASFDRPYAFLDGSYPVTTRGAASLVGPKELPMIDLVEKLGLDVTYWTDLDLSKRPQLLPNHHALITLGHDEYWSASMRNAALLARSLGVNIAFLGGNADFRHIRMESSRLGEARHEVNYKIATEDPLYGIENRRVTSNWRAPPVPRPESALNGAAWVCYPAHADMVVETAGQWVFQGTGLGNGSRISQVIGNEYDRVFPSFPTPWNIEILARSPASARCHPSDMTYYTSRSEAGVLDAGTTGWTGALGIDCVLLQSCANRNLAAIRVTENVLSVFAVGPAGLEHPSIPNLGRFGIRLKRPIQT
jgi:hypothetical protein